MDPKLNRDRANFYALYGVSSHVFSSVELAVEIGIRNLLKITNKQVSIICGGLSMGDKVAILRSLVAADPGCGYDVAPIEEAQKAASRNAYAHGVLALDTTGKDHYFLLVREVKNEYKVTARHMTLAKMDARATAIGKAYDRVLVGLKVSQADMDNYVKALASHAPDDHFLENNPQQEKTS